MTEQTREPEQTAAPATLAAPVQDFAGLSALVTGGASGIGAATAALLTARGARVAVLDRDTAYAPEGTFPVTADVTSDQAVRAAVGLAAAELGGLHILVSNAGIGAIGTVEDNPDDEWRRVIDINVLGMVRAARAALPHLREAAAARPGCASITHTCSIAATAGSSAGPVQRDQGRRTLPHPGDGGRPRTRRRPRQLRQPRNRRHPLDRPPPRPGRGPGRRASGPQRPPAAGSAGQRRRGRRGDRLPGEPRGGERHRHRARRRRRNAGTPPATHAATETTWQNASLLSRTISYHRTSSPHRADHPTN